VNAILEIDGLLDRRPTIENATLVQAVVEAPRRELILSLIGLLHGLAWILISIAAYPKGPPTPERKGILLIAVGLLMAYCSLCGHWWARTDWPLKVKTPAALLAALAAWGVLLTVLDASLEQADRAAGWATSFATQFFLAAIFSAALELAIQRRGISWRRRFTILTLFVWTTMVACFLGGGRWLVNRFGWNAETFFAWNYFEQLQVVGCANAALAAAIFGCVRLTTHWPARCASCLAVLVLAPACTVGLMAMIFGSNIGSSAGDLLWLTAAQGVFLTATLLPLQMLSQHDQLRNVSNR
jgi:hypothetical protein